MWYIKLTFLKRHVLQIGIIVFTKQSQNLLVFGLKHKFTIYKPKQWHDLLKILILNSSFLESKWKLIFGNVLQMTMIA